MPQSGIFHLIIPDAELRLDYTETIGGQFGSFGSNQEKDGGNELHQTVTMAMMDWQGVVCKTKKSKDDNRRLKVNWTVEVLESEQFWKKTQRSPRPLQKQLLGKKKTTKNKMLYYILNIWITVKQEQFP